jgi:hypothetical protein
LISLLGAASETDNIFAGGEPSATWTFKMFLRAIRAALSKLLIESAIPTKPFVGSLAASVTAHSSPSLRAEHFALSRIERVTRLASSTGT